MNKTLLIVGIALAVVGVAGYVYVTAAAADCDTTPGRLAQIGDDGIRDQCRMAALVINGAVVAVVVGGVLVVGALVV